MKLVGLILCALVLASQDAVVGRVESTFDKKTDFEALRTYGWTSGYSAHRPDADKLIVASCEAEMARLGLTKVTTGADVTLAYYTVTSLDVDLKALDTMEREGRAGVAPTKALGRLVLIMRGRTSNQLWSASTREHVDPDPVKLGETIRSATARLFATYPTRKRARQD